MGERLSYSEPLPTAMSLLRNSIYQKYWKRLKATRHLLQNSLHIEKNPLGEVQIVWSAEKKRLLKIILLIDVTYW